MEYPGVHGPVVISPNVDKEITTLAVSVNFDSYIENHENRTL